MNAKYWVKQTERIEFGFRTTYVKSYVTVIYKECESAFAEKVIAYIEEELGIIGINSDRFHNDDTIEVDFIVHSREDGEDVLEAYREAKKLYKCK